MIFSIVLGVIFLLILLDSIGSKQVRRLVIREAKATFETAFEEQEEPNRQALNTLPTVIQQYFEASHAVKNTTIRTLRMKVKGARKAAAKK